MLRLMKPTYAFERQHSTVQYLLYGGLILLYIHIGNGCFAQKPPQRELDINQFIAELFPIPPDDSDEDLYEALSQLHASPLDLNSASRDELSATWILSEAQIDAFFKYKQQTGTLLSLYELQAIPELDLPTIHRLLPFVTLGPRKASLRESLKNPGQHFLMYRSGKILEKQKGFTQPERGTAASNRYQGPAWNGYLRYRHARASAYSFGITLEKDAGEKWWRWNPERQLFGVDFSSVHMQLMNRGKIANLVIGDFQMQAGQGLVFGAGFSLGKGSEVIKTVYRSTTGLKPYTSATEANFFRGAAATFNITSAMAITLLFSRAKRDATQESDSVHSSITTSVPLTGYHRTPSEIEKHHILTEHDVGVHLLNKFPGQKAQVGLTCLYTAYDSFVRKRNWPYNRFEFSGTQNLITGVHGDYHWQNFHFFGEGATSRRGAGGIAGLVTSFGKKWDASMLARAYARDFHSFYGNAVSEGTRPINERGVYAGVRFSPRRQWQLAAFADYFRFPWLKFQVDAPSEGFDYYLQIQWKPSKRLNAYILYREKHKEQNDPESEEVISPLTGTVRRTAIFNLEYETPLKFSLRTRLQCGGMKYKTMAASTGLTVLQDITWHVAKLELSARAAFFHTDDYDSRQYVYEKDMLYAFSIPAYYNTGTRHYIMARYALSKHLKIWLRWSQSRYSDIDKISSGLNEIDGNKRSEAKVQVMYQF